MAKPSRILYIQPYHWECGPHQSLRALVANLDRASFSPLVVLAAAGAVAEEFIQLGAEVYFDSGIRTTPRSLSPIRQLKFWSAMWASARRLARLILREDVCLVHVNSEACWVGGPAAKMAHVPTIFHLRGLSMLSPPWVGRLTTLALNKFNPTLIATSHAVKRAYMTSGVRPELIQVIYNGLNVAAFDPRRSHPILRSELGVEDGQPLVGMIANFEPRKGHHYFVKSCALVRERIPHAQFVIVGGTHLTNGIDYYHQVQQLAARHGLTKAIRFLGPRRDIPDILASLDVVVQPSLTEAGPRVPIEAMAMERPIVVTDVGGSPEEVIDGQNGLVVPAGDVHALGNAIVKLLSDPPWAQRMGAAGRQRVLSMFVHEIHVLQVQELYNRLLAMNRYS